MIRKGLTKKQRFDVFDRDGFMCQYCGRDPINFDVVLEVDHCISVKDGGGNDLGNLITSCFDCNRGKSKKTIILGKDIDVEVEKEKLKNAKERLKQINQIKQIRSKKQEILDEIDYKKFGFIKEKLYCYSDQFIKRMNMIIKGRYNKGYDIVILEECLDITIRKFENDEFYSDDFAKYFYGVLRNT